MKIEKQVVNQKLAKQLKEEGYPQEKNLWYWHLHWGIKGDVPVIYNSRLYGDDGKTYVCVAPTVAELGEKLPRGYITAFGGQSWQCFKITDVRCCPIDFKQLDINADTEANARAKMWLYLKKKGLIDV